MKQLSISKATPEQINWMVAHHEKVNCFDKWQTPYLEPNGKDKYPTVPFTPTTDWTQAGVIIDREEISVFKMRNGWRGGIAKAGEIYVSEGENPLIAAMRCYVFMKANEVFMEVPDEIADLENKSHVV